MVVKSLAAPLAMSVMAVVVVVATPAAALDPVVGQAFARVCLPYAQRSASLERAIAKARELDFRRPAGDNAPLDEWASEIELVSNDGRWRLRLEEGSADGENGQNEIYAVTCSLTSNLAGYRELIALADYGFGNDPRWRRAADQSPRWDRITDRSEEYSLSVRVRQPDGLRPIIAAIGEYR